MHARGATNRVFDEEWMECIAACIDEGNKTGMQSGVMMKKVGPGLQEALCEMGINIMCAGWKSGV